MTERRKANPKRQLRPLATMSSVDLEQLALKVRYGGNPAHKRNPGDFGLTPPASPRQGKTLCDATGVLTRGAALDLLRKGVRLGLISVREVEGWPQNIWAVVEGEVRMPVEAMLENPLLGTYHGYPMQDGDPLAEDVILRWFGGEA